MTFARNRVSRAKYRMKTFLKEWTEGAAVYTQGEDGQPGTSQPCACAAMRRSSRAVTQLYDLVLAPTGLKATQFIALKVIHDAGEIAQYEYAREYAVSVETLSRRLGSLRTKGLVEVRTGQRHGERIYTLSEKGQKVFTDAWPHWSRAQDRLKTALGESDWELLLRLSDRVAKAAAEAETLRVANSDGHR